MTHEEVRDFFQRHDKLAVLLGMELREVSAGGAKAKMEIKPQHLNGAGIAHGGAIFALADFAFAAACNSRDFVAVAAHADISFLRPAGEGALYAEAKELSLSRKLGVYEIRVSDAAGNLVAAFHGIAYRKDAKLETLLERPEKTGC